MQLRSSKRKQIIKDFFMSFLETIIKELETQTQGTDITLRKIKIYSDFLYLHKKEQVTPYKVLFDFHYIFDFEWLSKLVDSEQWGCSSYKLMTKSEKEIARNIGSKKKYKKFPIVSKIHDEIDSLETKKIPELVSFFTYRYDLFEELKNEMDSVM